MTDDDRSDEPIDLPVDGTLDLHTFSPKEIKDLIPGYLEACRERGIDQVRIVHGKGSGALRSTVQALLGRLPIVASFRTAGPDGGGWGATIVTLRTGMPGTVAAIGTEKVGSEPRRSLRLETLAERLTICRLPPGAELPAGLAAGKGFVSITRTRDELSIVCREGDAPGGAGCSGTWRAIRVEGTLDFSDTGVLLSLASPLAEAGIPIFVVSTHDTDYLLVNDDRFDRAQHRLRAAGHTIDGK